MTGGLPDFDRSFLPEMEAAFARHADKVCVQYGDGSYTYRDVDHLSARVANALVDAGFRKGMKGAVYSANSAMSFFAAIGLVRAGGVWLAVNPRNAAAINVETVTRFGCEALFYQRAFDEPAQRIRSRLGPPAVMVSLDDPEAEHPFVADWVADHPAEAPRLSLTGEDLLSIPTTGGTTGVPKGVMLSHRNFTAFSYGMTRRYGGRDPVVLCAAPMSHVGGRIALASMEAGARFVVMDKVDPRAVLRAIEDERITDFFLPPTALFALIDQPDVRNFDLSSLVSVSYGSAPMSVARIRQAMDVLGPVMRGGFGQTESPMFIAGLSPEEHYLDGEPAPDHRLRSVGRATDLSEIAIVDDRGHELPPGERGEIAVKGPMVFEGYYCDPEETAKVRVNGWHLTGDIGYLDEEGYLYIVDRKKDMIITGGFNVYSTEVEQCLLAMDGIRQAVIIGVPSDKWGEQVKAIVQLQPGSELTQERIIAHCKERLGGVMAPKSVEFRDDLPTTAVGKIDKKALRSAYWPVDREI